ncbi:hypothetical protein ACN20G_17875 [Streptomyces sp. BI20]|uniref:hypothetical protein n=1 Tax=Streptomyces sp. BI20 TaxID=3403460 RepID=UPI003C71E516
MFSRKPRAPKSPELLAAWKALEAGAVPDAISLLRDAAEEAPVVETALVVARAAEMAGIAELARAAGAVSSKPGGQELFSFGYACVEAGLPEVAVPVLRDLLRVAGGQPVVLWELVSAYEALGRHAEAAEVLAAQGPALPEWPGGYLLVHNALLAGDVATARARHAALAPPADPEWAGAYARQSRMVARAALLDGSDWLGPTGLRGWQFVMGGTVLGTLSPHGFEQGMTGRYAFLQDEAALCLLGLRRLKALLVTAGVGVRSVSLLPDRDSRILGLVAAGVLGLPVREFAPGEPDTVVVAYDLNRVGTSEEGAAALAALRTRVPGQVLHEHVSDWTDAPVVTADSVALLAQVVTPPWGAALRVGADGGAERGPADERPEAEVAAGILAAAASTEAAELLPADLDLRFTAFAASVAGLWLDGDRDRLMSTGPVPSNRF